MVQFYIGVDSIVQCRLPTTPHATLCLTICQSAAGRIRRDGLTVLSASISERRSFPEFGASTQRFESRPEN
jgi:hypothetical protein